MLRGLLLSIVFLAIDAASAQVRDAATLQAALDKRPAALELPAGIVHLKRPLVIPNGTSHLELRGNPAGSTLVLDPDFRGAAAVLADTVSNLTLSGFTIAGNRADLQSNWNLPLNEAAFADYYADNGIVIRHSRNVTISGVRFLRICAFPVIVNATAGAVIASVTVEDSGTLNPDGHNNTTGGILIEEGSSAFEVRNSKFSRIAGTAIWTHSYARSPRQSDGVIAGNTISTVARDAIQIGHATRVRVENNRGSDIGFPAEYIDFAGYGTPVALDTAGNVDHTTYSNNDFTAVNGQCIDLDGFHDGAVTANRCTNVPATAAQWLGLHFGILFGNHDRGMTSTNIAITGNTLRGFAYGGVFLIGEHNRIEGNRFLDVNLARCGSQPVPAKCNAMADEPDALRSGIYLSDNGGRIAATRGNVIRNNVIQGFGMPEHCIAAKRGVDLKANTISGNTCESAPSAH